MVSSISLLRLPTSLQWAWATASYLVVPPLRTQLRVQIKPCRTLCLRGRPSDSRYAAIHSRTLRPLPVCRLPVGIASAILRAARYWYCAGQGGKGAKGPGAISASVPGALAANDRLAEAVIHTTRGIRRGQGTTEGSNNRVVRSPIARLVLLMAIRAFSPPGRPSSGQRRYRLRSPAC